MTITVFGATGQVGLQVVQQAIAKNWKVIAFGRDISAWIDKDMSSENFTATKGYVFNQDDIKKAIEPAQAVISCLGGSIDGTDKTRSLGMKNIVTAMQKLDKQRIIAVGGMGILQANDEQLIIETENYPKEFLPVGIEHWQAYKHLQTSGLHYSSICPPNILNQPASHNYLTQKNYHPSNTSFSITAGDIADCMLNCIENELFVGDRVGICQ